MRNFLFYFFIFFLAHSAYSQITEVDYYAYLIPGKNVIVCSEKEYLKSNLILNEFESENGYTCLINLKKNGIYRVTLHISRVEDNLGMFEDMIKNDSQAEKNLMDVTIGNHPLYREIDLTLFSSRPLNKQFLVQYDHGKIFFINGKNCDLNTNKGCEYVDLKNTIFMKKFIKLNFSFKKPNYQEVTLLEKEFSSKFKNSEDCDPPCINGLCSDGECLCQGGYMGINCSIKLQITETRISLIVLIALLVGAMGLGILIMWLFYICFAAIFRGEQVKENSNEVDIMEHWGGQS